MTKTNQQIAEELLKVLSNSQPHNPAWVVKETLEKLRELLSDADFTYDWGNMVHTTWDDCLGKIDEICDELEVK